MALTLPSAIQGLFYTHFSDVETETQEGKCLAQDVTFTKLTLYLRLTQISFCYPLVYPFNNCDWSACYEPGARPGARTHVGE